MKRSGSKNVWAFLASGNVVFTSAERSKKKLTKLIEEGLQESLGYPVGTFLRTGPEVRSVAEFEPFETLKGAKGGKLQVSFLAKAPTVAQAKKALGFATERDRLAIEGQELYWLPEAGLTDSDLNVAEIEKALGTTTTRTRNTVERLVVKLG